MRPKNKKEQAPDYTKPGHYLMQDEDGHGNGYDLLADGSYKLAPCDHDAFVAIQAEQQALKQLLDEVYTHAAKRYRAAEERRIKWYGRVVRGVRRDADLGRASYDAYRNRLTFLPPPEPKEQT